MNNIIEDYLTIILKSHRSKEQLMHELEDYIYQVIDFERMNFNDYAYIGEKYIIKGFQNLPLKEQNVRILCAIETCDCFFRHNSLILNNEEYDKTKIFAYLFLYSQLLVPEMELV